MNEKLLEIEDLIKEIESDITRLTVNVYENEAIITRLSKRIRLLKTILFDELRRT